MTKAERYVQLRFDGAGVREAAREAGFAHGVPSPEARELHAACETMQNNRGARSWMETHVREIEETLSHLRLMLRADDVLTKLDVMR